MPTQNPEPIPVTSESMVIEAAVKEWLLRGRSLVQIEERLRFVAVQQAIILAGGHHQKAAARLDIHRNTAARIMKNEAQP